MELHIQSPSYLLVRLVCMNSLTGINLFALKVTQFIAALSLQSALKL
jgi:hypothetical protein